MLRLRPLLRTNRRTHATLALCALLVAAGCVGPLPVGNQPDATPTAATLPPAGVHPGLTAGLTLYTRLQVHVTVTELGQQGRGVVVDRTYDERSRIEYGDGEVFRANGDYRVVIAVNGTVRWNETVHHFEYYELRVADNGTVVVQSHAMA